MLAVCVLFAQFTMNILKLLATAVKQPRAEIGKQ